VDLLKAFIFKSFLERAEWSKIVTTLDHAKMHKRIFAWFNFVFLDTFWYNLMYLTFGAICCHFGYIFFNHAIISYIFGTLRVISWCIFGAAYDNPIALSKIYENLPSDAKGKESIIFFFLNTFSHMLSSKYINWKVARPGRAFRTSESADFSEVRVRKFRTLKTLRTRTQRVC
jgi:nucleoid DNA-binding protein